MELMDLLLSERIRRVLGMIIESYIQTAEPIGSKLISRASSINLSPATIRSIMSDLEEMGLLYQPHTSAGRVPTERGFRYYIDFILNVHELSPREQEKIRSSYTSDPLESVDLFRETSRILSLSSHYLGVVWAPRMNMVVLQHIEFVKLRGRLVLVLLVSTNSLVENRVVEVEEDFSQSELDRLSDTMNELLVGLTLHQVRDKIVQQMELEKNTYDRLLEQALKLGEKAFSPVETSDVYIEGRTNILNEVEFGDVSRMRSLFQAFEEKATMVKLLNKCLDPKGVKISIGSENPIHEIDDCSLVTSTYSCRGEVLGALGVIGPRRMNYSKVIPLVDYAAKLLTEMLEAR
jgi:heat-inducible transcriptional repressor